MSDSQEQQQVPTSAKVKMYAAMGALYGGAALFTVGLAVGPIVDWAQGAYMMIAGLGLIQASSVGRPVFINVFNEVAEAPKRRGDSPGGYL